MTAFFRYVAPIALLCALPLPARAADGVGSSARNPAAAQALFEEAQRRVTAGDYEQACPKFKASYSLDPAGGTLLNLADCLERQGRVASAWSTFKDALVQAQRDGRSERMTFAEEHIRALESKLAYLTIEVPAAANAAELAIEVDGTPLASAAWGTPLPVDPGAHVVRARAPGFESFEQRVKVGTEPGVKQTLVLPPLQADSSSQAAASPAAGTSPPSPLGIESTTGMEDAGATAHPARTWGYVTGAAGLIALGAGSYFGMRAFSLWDDRQKDCAGGCTSAAKQAGDDASSAASVATVGVTAGVVLLGAATAMIFYSSDVEQPEQVRQEGLSFSADTHGASLSWGGSF
ncbi:MAG: hypothetical protein RL685_7493 [Pseudomonadota bacterium]|jgi:hypothetical protein